MNEHPAWQWNEIQQVGTDYSDVAEVERYEQRMGEFRDLPAEDAAILDTLALAKGARILEIGTGTGHFARAAAKAGYCVTALDVSTAMLQYAEDRAKADGLTGLEFRHAGFLTLSAAPSTFDAAVSVAVLHHLPDLWKAVALANIHRALKPGGRFLLCDVVFSSKGRDPRVQFDAFLNTVPQSMRDGASCHVAKEYSTLDWIMEGLLTRAGFSIECIVDSEAPLIQYRCTTGSSGSEPTKRAY
ncbi:MAG: class I SAM-dependent methyltransferase [Planctomycetaceae bacterium]|nr:class I SAM-dependent methyltransferase [Planctomycetaceae bacterium]